MFKAISFEIPGIPMAKQRPRITKEGHAYTPDQTVRYENLVKLCFTQTNKNKVYWDNEPIRVHIIAMFPIPKSYNKTRRQVCLSGKISPSNKDCDNIAKIVCDALNNVAYNDDKHIVQLIVNKLFTKEIPKTMVFISTHQIPFTDVNNILEHETMVFEKVNK